MPGIRGDNEPALVRAKRADNREWVQGYRIRFGADGKDYVVPENASALYAYEVISSTICGDTGKRDRSGTRVFSHDIVRNGGKVHVIAWMAPDAKYAAYLLSECRMDAGTETTGAEVIGNIFDNPEFLPEERKERYRCIKEMQIQMCDGDGLEIPGKYTCITPGSTWKGDGVMDFCGSIRLYSLDSSRFGWIEISSEDLKNHFAGITDPQMDDQ